MKIVAWHSSNKWQSNCWMRLNTHAAVLWATKLFVRLPKIVVSFLCLSFSLWKWDWRKGVRVMNGMETLGSQLSSRRLLWRGQYVTLFCPGEEPWRKMKIHVYTKMCTWMHIALFIIASKWKQPNVHQLMNKQNVGYPFNRLFFRNEKELSPDTCYNMNEP